MRKHIRIFCVLLLVGLLALPMDALACADLKAARDKAQNKVNLLRDGVRAMSGFSNLNLADIGAIRDPEMRAKAMKSFIANRVALNQSKQKLEAAETVLASAQAK